MATNAQDLRLKPDLLFFAGLMIAGAQIPGYVWLSGHREWLIVDFASQNRQETDLPRLPRYRIKRRKAAFLSQPSAVNRKAKQRDEAD